MRSSPASVDRDDRRRVVAAPEHVFGEVQARVRKEPRAGHAIEVDGDSRSALALHAGELPERVPERRRVADREAMELAEIIESPPEPPARRSARTLSAASPAMRSAPGCQSGVTSRSLARSSRHSRQRFARANSSCEPRRVGADRGRHRRDASPEAPRRCSRRSWPECSPTPSKELAASLVISSNPRPAYLKPAFAERLGAGDHQPAGEQLRQVTQVGDGPIVRIRRHGRRLTRRRPATSRLTRSLASDDAVDAGDRNHGFATNRSRARRIKAAALAAGHRMAADEIDQPRRAPPPRSRDAWWTRRR